METITPSNFIETARFQEFPKMSRLSRDACITEKIDGSNAAVNIIPLWGGEWDGCVPATKIVNDHAVIAQSRTRIITPGDDNFGFARWVEENAEGLIENLGGGLHFGEWWGSGIQRTYDMKTKQFSLFNTHQWKDANFSVKGLRVVPLLFTGDFDTNKILEVMASLKTLGSQAAPGYMNPEGVVIYHTHAGTSFKKTFEKDDSGKGHGG